MPETSLLLWSANIHISTQSVKLSKEKKGKNITVSSVFPIIILM